MGQRGDRARSVGKEGSKVNTTPRTFHVLASPHKDGYGGSALLSYIIRALLRCLAPRFRVTIWSDKRSGREKEHLYNQVLFSEEVKQGRVRVVAVDNLIELQKPGGMTSISKTLAKIADYRGRSDRYPAMADTAGSPRFDLVLDFGVPAAARWARRMGMRSISVCDLSWSKTLELILKDLEDMSFNQLSEEHRFTKEQRERWLQLIEEIKEDEREVHTLFLCPPFITPHVFWKHWREEIGVAPVDIGGVLGGTHGIAPLLIDLGRVLEAPELTRTQAREFLRITEPGQSILIQAGDTPAWDDVLPRLVTGFIKLEREGHLGVNVTINIPGRFEFKELDDPTLKRVRRLGSSGGTIQKVLAAFDFMLTRAGGGSVNDTVAGRVPFACVDEPGQAQVRAILHACLESNLTRSISWNTFRDDPVRVALSQWAGESACRENGELATRLRGIPCHGEKSIVEAICLVLDESNESNGP